MLARMALPVRLLLVTSFALPALATQALGQVRIIRKADGSFVISEKQDFSLKKSFAEYVKDQRAHAKAVETKLGFDVKTHETTNFIIHGDIDPGLMRETSQLCEGLHAEFKRIFKYKKKEKLYAGKLELYLWQEAAPLDT